MYWYNLIMHMFSFGLNAELWWNCRTIDIGKTKLNLRCTLLIIKTKSFVLKMIIKTENSEIMFLWFLISWVCHITKKVNWY